MPAVPAAQREAAKRDNKQQQKLNTELGKIQKIMEDKGLDHASAFTREERQGARRGGGGGGGGSGGGEEPAMPTKRRRI